MKIKTKQCRECKQDVELEGFFNQKSAPDGKGYTCKKCMKIINEKSAKKMKTWDKLNLITGWGNPRIMKKVNNFSSYAVG